MWDYNAGYIMFLTVASDIICSTSVTLWVDRLACWCELYNHKGWHNWSNYRVWSDLLDHELFLRPVTYQSCCIANISIICISVCFLINFSLNVCTYRSSVLNTETLTIDDNFNLAFEMNRMFESMRVSNLAG